MKCPKCKKNELDKVKVRNSLSRRDNKTYICNDCGLREAFEDHERATGIKIEVCGS